MALPWHLEPPSSAVTRQSPGKAPVAPPVAASPRWTALHRTCWGRRSTLLDISGQIHMEKNHWKMQNFWKKSSRNLQWKTRKSTNVGRFGRCWMMDILETSHEALQDLDLHFRITYSPKQVGTRWAHLNMYMYRFRCNLYVPSVGFFISLCMCLLILRTYSIFISS